MSALFHNDNLLARSYSSLDVRPARVRLMCGPEPLWEDSSTFTSEELAKYKARTKNINQRFARLSNATGNGGTKSPFKVSMISSFVSISRPRHGHPSSDFEHRGIFHAPSTPNCALCSNNKTTRSSTTTSYQICVTSKTFSILDAATGPRNQGFSTAALRQNPVTQDRTASTRRPADLPRRTPYVINVPVSGRTSLDQVRRCSRVGQDHKTGKVVVIKSEKPTSQHKPEVQERRPSGFTSWRNS